jgi:NAD(P)-dependent dehydrogenase (short-subunit alcohol dehydrogenase family)
MAGRVAGKVVLLTGGAMGLGKAATKALMAEGATVIITDIDEAAITGFGSIADISPEDFKRCYVVAKPIDRMSEVDDIAHLLVYLASDQSRFATGAPFFVNGGLSIA